jgi:NaMN:DMB phosphoribosyltransferase
MSAGMFGLIGIAAVSRHDVILAVLVFLVAIGCAVRANSEWKREHS